MPEPTARAAHVRRPYPDPAHFTSHDAFIAAVAAWAADQQLAARWEAVMAELDLLQCRVALLEQRQAEAQGGSVNNS